MTGSNPAPDPTRGASTLQKPDPTRDFRDFPPHRRRAGVRLYRAHRGEHGPWYFSSTAGRFNLHSPRGTLNTSAAREVAVREFLGLVLVGDPFIPASTLTDRWVSELEVPALNAADFTAGAAMAFGIAPGDITAPMDDDYEVTRSWATAMDEAGFDGIRSRSRFGAGPDPTCLFIFGDAGEHILGDVHDKHTMRSVIESIPGYTIDPIPLSGTLIIDP